MSNAIFYKGQAVGCLMYGEGQVMQIDGNYISVGFDHGLESFHHNGAYMQHLRPTLYHIDQYREIIANLPAPQPEAWKPKPGEWCWFWDKGYKSAVLNMFASIEADKKFPYMTKTGTSYHNCAQFVGELPDHLKEVQP